MNPNDPACHECGRPFVIDEAGIATHLTDDGDIDYDQDADHVPFSLVNAIANHVDDEEDTP